MNLKGNIVNGIGTAKYWVEKINKTFYKKTNKVLYPGTLNIKLESQYLLTPDFIIDKEEFGGTENVLVQKCKIFERDAYIIRAEKNQKGTGDHKLDIIEIVSDINFRNMYKLTNNQKIIVAINQDV